LHVGDIVEPQLGDTVPRAAGAEGIAGANAVTLHVASHVAIEFGDAADERDVLVAPVVIELFVGHAGLAHGADGQLDHDCSPAVTSAPV